MSQYNSIFCPRTGTLQSLATPEGVQVLKAYVRLLVQQKTRIQSGGLFETFVHVRGLSLDASNSSPNVWKRNKIVAYKKYFDRNVTKAPSYQYSLRNIFIYVKICGIYIFFLLCIV